MKKRCANSAATDGGVSIVLPHDLLAEEILTRLPAKSLMRFRCVSKQWRSTIADPSFSKAHRAHSSLSLLIRNPSDGDSSSLRFFCATLPHRGQSSFLYQFTLPSLRGKYHRTSNVINGIVCLLSSECVALFNITTREVIEFELPDSPLGNFFALAYFLGFDSTTKEFKLLRAHSLLHERFETEILTLGKDASWRILGSVPPTYLWWNQRQDRIDGFDFGKESFILIPPPPTYGSLVQFRGHLGVARSRWLEDDRKIEFCVQELEGGGDGISVFKWIEQVMIDTSQASDCPACDFNKNNLLTDELIVMRYIRTDTDEHGMHVYSYDHKGMVVGLVIGDLESNPKGLVGKISHNFRILFYKEDITPLKDLTNTMVIHYMPTLLGYSCVTIQYND